MPNSKPARVTLDEKRLAREMHFERGLAPSRVAEALGRCLSAVVRLLAQKRQPKRVGRPALLSPAQVDKIHKTLTALVDKADGRFEVTVAMVKRRARVKASERVVSEALHARGVYFRKMREKPIMKPWRGSTRTSRLSGGFATSTCTKTTITSRSRRLMRVDAS